MNLRKGQHHRVSFHYWGWTIRPFFPGSYRRKDVFVLTSLFIERDYRQVAFQRTGRPGAIPNGNDDAE